MTLLRRIFAVLVLGSGIAHAATPLTNVISDQAAIVVAVHNAPSLISQWEKSPWSKTWNDEQVKKFFAPSRTRMKADEWNTTVKQKTGYTLEELLAFATGDAVIVLSDMKFALSEDTAKEPPILIGVEIGDNEAKITELLSKSSKDDEDTVETEEFSGVTLHIVTPKAKEGAEEKSPTPTVWAIVEGKWFVSPMKEQVMAAIDAVKNGGVEHAWGRSEGFARMQQRAGEPHVSLVVNIEAIYPVIKAAVEARQAATAGQQQGPMAFDGNALLSALAMDTWRSFYATARIGDDATSVHAGLTYTEAKGLLKLLAYKDGPVATPAFVSPKWLTVSTDKFSVKEFWGALEELLENFNPAIAGLMQGQIRAMNKQLGVDLKRDLIGSLGDDVIMINTLAPGANADSGAGLDSLEQLIAISLTDAAAFNNAIEAIKRSFGPQGDSLFKSREYLGEKIITFEPPAQQDAAAAPKKKGVSYAIAKGYLFVSIGSASPLETALQQLSEKRATLWEQPDVRAALGQMPANACAFRYQDIKSMIAVMFQTFANAAQMMNHPKGPQPTVVEGEDGPAEASEPPTTEKNESTLPVDPTAIPTSADVGKYWSYGWGYAVREATGIHGTSQIIHPK